MKKLYKPYFLFILLVAICISGCGQYEATSDLVLGGIEIDMPKSDFEDLDYEWVKSEGTHYGYVTLDYSFGVVVTKEGNKVTDVSIHRRKKYSDLEDKVATKYGITLNSPVDEIEKKHGVPIAKNLNPNKTNRGSISYRIKRRDGGYGTLQFTIDLKENKIEKIRIWSMDIYKDYGKTSTDNASVDDNKNVDTKKDVAVDKSERMNAKSNDSLSLGNISLNNKANDINSILGNPISTESKEGNISILKYNDITVYKKNSEIQMLISNSPNAQTSKGIHEGSLISDFVHEYGSDYTTTQYGNLDLHEYNVKDKNGNPCILRFAVEKGDNRVKYISVRRADI